MLQTRVAHMGGNQDSCGNCWWDVLGRAECSDESDESDERIEYESILHLPYNRFWLIASVHVPQAQHLSGGHATADGRVRNWQVILPQYSLAPDTIGHAPGPHSQFSLSLLCRSLSEVPASIEAQVWSLLSPVAHFHLIFLLDHHNNKSLSIHDFCLNCTSIFYIRRELTAG